MAHSARACGEDGLISTPELGSITPQFVRRNPARTKHCPNFNQWPRREMQLWIRIFVRLHGYKDEAVVEIIPLKPENPLPCVAPMVTPACANAVRTICGRAKRPHSHRISLGHGTWRRVGAHFRAIDDSECNANASREGQHQKDNETFHRIGCRRQPGSTVIEEAFECWASAL